MSELDETNERCLGADASPTQMVRGRSRTVMSFAHVVDRAQLGDAVRGKAEAEMIRAVPRVQKVVVRRTVGCVRRTDPKPILGEVCPNSAVLLKHRGLDCNNRLVP